MTYSPGPPALASMPSPVPWPMSSYWNRMVLVPVITTLIPYSVVPFSDASTPWDARAAWASTAFSRVV